MRNWQTITGGAAWMLVATLMASAALQPVDILAATVRADGASKLLTVFRPTQDGSGKSIPL